MTYISATLGINTVGEAGEKPASGVVQTPRAGDDVKRIGQHSAPLKVRQPHPGPAELPLLILPLLKCKKTIEVSQIPAELEILPNLPNISANHKKTLRFFEIPAELALFANLPNIPANH